MEATKICFKCKKEKLLSEYYKHKKMSDGHLNKCKDCARVDVRKREENLKKDSEWVENEKARHRDKYYRLRYKEKHKPTPEQKKKSMDRYRNKYPEKYKAKNVTQRFPRKEGCELHHWSYNKEHYSCVIELTTEDHYTAHRFMIYDQERMMYRRCDNGELLDTREKHYAFISARILEEQQK